MTLSQTIISLVPDIVELKAGCVLRSKDYEYDDNREFTIVAGHGLCLKHKTKRGCENADGTCDETDGFTLIAQGGEMDDFGYIQREIENGKVSEKYEILGRPITLADVLRAIRLSKVIFYDTDLVFGNQPDILLIGHDYHEDENSYRKWCRWSLSKDLDGQLSETLVFLRTLLGANEG